jgi:MinD superfamily P-loop ATPase
MKEIVIISGKGGTGKTSITAAFALLGGPEIVVADCDVDAADMHLLLQPDFAGAEDFYSGQVALIDQEMCTRCGKCAEVCRFDAIPVIEDSYIVQPLDCEGCGFCGRVCSDNAITFLDQNVGEWYISSTRAANTMVHARLGVGAENSGKLVARVKVESRRIAEATGKELIVVDGSPGIGCPVVSSLSGAALVVLVTEPTVSGLHDLKRVYQLVKKFDIPAGCIINKYNLNLEVSREIEDYLKQEGITHIADLPYDETFTRAMTEGLTIVEYDSDELKEILVESWEKVKSMTKSDLK